jgi:RNA polymerase sigma factor (sigma-70 family)
VAATGSWLHRICTNVAYTVLRQKTRRRTRSTGDEDVAAIADTDPVVDPAGRADNAEFADWAVHRIDGLSPALRSVMRKRLGGGSYPEIAGQLGISTGTARVRGLRARHHLREAARREGLSP